MLIIEKDVRSERIKEGSLERNFWIKFKNFRDIEKEQEDMSWRTT